MLDRTTDRHSDVGFRYFLQETMFNAVAGQWVPVVE
jgi:hypothetical protein